MDFVLSRVAVLHAVNHLQRRVQLDGHVQTRQRHRDTVRTVGVLRSVGDADRTTKQKLRVQQDETGGVVRVQLRRQKRTVAVRPRVSQIRVGGRVRFMRQPQVSTLGQMFPDVGPGLQVLLGL